MASFYNADNTKKYIYASGNTEIASANADGTQNVITLVFREAATWNYSLKAVNAEGTTLIENMASGSAFEQDVVNVPYRKFINVEGTLNEAGQGSAGWYLHTLTLAQDNQVETITYNPSEINNVVYFAEAEEIDGLTSVSTGNANIRCSNGLGAYNEGETVTVTTLQPGVYHIAAGIWGNAEENILKINIGDQEWSISTKGYFTEVTPGEEDITLNAPTTITIPTCGKGGTGVRCFDYIYIQKTGDVEQTTPTYAVGKLDFATIEDLSSSSIVDNTLTLEADEFTATFTGNVSYREFNGKKYIGIEAAGCNLVIKGKDGKRINRVVFTSSTNFSIKAQQGTLDGKIWTGDEEEVTFTNGAFDTEITGITVGDYVEPATDVENIGALKGIATGTNVNLKLNGAVVTFVKDNLAFIEDETGAIKLNNIGLSLTAGTALNGNLYATYTGGSIPSLGSNAQTATSEFTSEETTVTPTLATVQGLNGMMYTNRLIKLVGSMSVSGNWLMFGGTSVWIDDYFNVLPDGYEYPSEIGSLLAIGGSDGAAQEIYPVSAEDIIEPANVQPEKADYDAVLWTSDNEAVATVDEAGLVTAVAAGTANIRVEVKEFSASCAVTVFAGNKLADNAQVGDFYLADG